LNFVTDFADQAVILPLILVTAAMLIIQGWARGAIAWLLATAGAFGLMLLLKLVFLSCGWLNAPGAIVSPSGHAAAAALVAGGFAALFSPSRLGVAVVAAIAAILIGQTRLALGVHSVAEVILGALVGIGGAVALHGMAGPPPNLRVLPLAVAVGAVVIALHGTRLPAETTIRHTAGLLRQLVPVCQASPGRHPHLVPPARGAGTGT
jgi:membrane-associated phospholipid phosphatase